ncbi:hypothetical protein EDD16DRAFT_1541374 [Pisolithus croceorrhizus]|nr:hypothetical protein EDD16DRAFT_1541374 [Pisolithus croceorrhizus]KAI6135100.1 hypothetical protein EV401DRAFT_1902636 [Pisolithus croceorrhizus]KAI6163183.1 hypothetical protein EDD17DRAFT_1571692 [Pisolithus thermaeus]
MALNWVMLDAIRNPVPIQDETTITTVDAECTLIVPNASSASSSTSGASGHLKMKESGTIHLTDKRLTFTTRSNGSAKLSFESLTIPLESILSSKFEQPYFSSNYLVLGIRPSAGGGLTHGTMLEIRSLNTGLFSFVSVLEKTRERAIYMKRRSLDDDENLPAYSSGTAGGSSHLDDMPPGYDS